MDVEKIIKQSVEVSQQFDSMATQVFQKAKSAVKSGKIDHSQYKQLMENYYLPLMNYSSRILMNASITVITDLDKYMTELEASTERLSEVADKIERTEHIFKTLTYLLAAAAAVASFAAAPSLAGFEASAASIVGAIESISKLVG